MTRLRFSQAQQVLDAVPDLHSELTTPAGSHDPLAFVDRLIADGKPDEAVAFCSFLLPRREAVQWLCSSIRNLGPTLTADDEVAMKTAETWVKAPTETARKAASLAADAGDKARIGTWAAYAAAWTGGNLTKDDEHPVPPPTHLTGVAVKAGHHILALLTPPADRHQLLENAVEAAINLLKQEKA